MCDEEEVEYKPLYLMLTQLESRELGSQDSLEKRQGESGVFKELTLPAHKTVNTFVSKPITCTECPVSFKVVNSDFSLSQEFKLEG